MRVRHLTAIEIQALLDRRAVGRPADVSGERYRKDLDSQEHLDNCPTCRSEAEQYRGLYAELGRCEQRYLSRNFARKVTFSLPPFKARRTRARLQLAAIWGASLMVSFFWLVGQINLGFVVARAISAVFDLSQFAGSAWVVVGAVFPLSDLMVTWFLRPLSEIATSVERAFTTDVGPANMILFAGLVLLMISWIDRLYQLTMRQRS